MAKVLVLPKTNYSPPVDVESVAPHIGKRLRLLRLTKGLSQADLGKIIRVSFQQIQKYERGLNHISAANLYHFSQALSVSVSYFFEGLDHSSSARDNTVENSLLGVSDLRTSEALRTLLAIQRTKRGGDILRLLKAILESSEK